MIVGTLTNTEYQSDKPMSDPSSLPLSHTPVPGPGGTALGAECTYSRSAEALEQTRAGAMHGSAVAGQIHAQGAPSGTMTISTPKDSGDNHEPQERATAEHESVRMGADDLSNKQGMQGQAAQIRVTIWRATSWPHTSL